MAANLQQRNVQVLTRQATFGGQAPLAESNRPAELTPLSAPSCTAG